MPFDLAALPPISIDRYFVCRSLMLLAGFLGGLFLGFWLLSRGMIR